MPVNWSALLVFLVFVIALVVSQPWRGDPGTVRECMGPDHGARVACAEWEQD